MPKSLISIIVLSALTVLPLGGCDSKVEDSKPSKPEPAPEHAPEHAAAGVQPGSYEDWCGEHQVPESLCSRCNPSLIAAFKATGDWCPEHELPESQCLICNPDLKIERPPRPSEASP